MKLHLVVVEVLFGCLVALPALCADAETPWDALRHLSRHHVYTVLNRDGSCLSGPFVSISDNAFVIDQEGEKEVPRAGILRISLGETPDVHFAVFSARSSWADLSVLQNPPYYTQMMVITADDRQFSGPLLGVANDQLTLMVDGKEMRFAKEYVARVFLTGKKPAFTQTGLHLNVRDLSKKVIAPMQPVPLYEVTSSQDNTQLDCSPAYRRRPPQ